MALFWTRETRRREEPAQRAGKKAPRRLLRGVSRPARRLIQAPGLVPAVKGTKSG